MSSTDAEQPVTTPKPTEKSESVSASQEEAGSDDNEQSGQGDDQTDTADRPRRERRAATQTDASSHTLIDRDEQRKKLAIQKNEEAKIRIANRAKNATGSDDPTKRVSTSYQATRDMPKGIPTDRIFIDLPHDTVLFPINGRLVPFHISMIKNVTHDTVNDYFILQVEFVTPTARKLPPGSLPHHAFVRNLQFRTRGSSLAEVYTSIKSLQTEYKTKIKAQSTARALVEQPRLQMLKNATVSLRDVLCRPQILTIKGKGRAAGVLTSHLNGFKYIVGDRSSGGVFIDIIYENIKSCYLQRADRRANIIIMHFELVNPILIRKDRSTKYLQFYVELMQESHDLTRSGMHDREAQHEEEEEERRERQRRKAWNERFATFAHDTEEQWAHHNPDLSLEFELPIRKYAFTGIVSKEIVDVIPTQNSLIALESMPPLVINLAEVECVSLERVGFGLREFDMVFIFKDFTQETKSIASIPMTGIEGIRSWLHDSSLLYFEFKHTINWRIVLEEIRQDELGFYEDGGWLAYFNDDDDYEEDEDDEEVSGVEVTDVNAEAAAAGEKRRKRQQDDSESDFELEEDEYESDSFTSDSDEDDEDSDEEAEPSSGADWDELEKEYADEDNQTEMKQRKREKERL